MANTYLNPEIYRLQECTFSIQRWLIVMHPFTMEMLNKVRSIPGRTYHPEIKTWSIPKSKAAFLHARATLGNNLIIETKVPEEWLRLPPVKIEESKRDKPKPRKQTKKAAALLPEPLQHLLLNYKKYMEQQRYSYNTIKTYSHLVKHFPFHFCRKGLGSTHSRRHHPI